MGFWVLTGCSSPVDETPVEDGTAIAFSADMSEREVTRSSTPLEETGITSFKVWAYKNMSYDEGTQTYGDLQTVMNGFYVRWETNTAATSTTNTHDWEYILTAYPSQTIKYWDFGAKAYRFVAVAPATANVSFPEDGSGNNLLVRFTADASGETVTPYYSRLWFSDNSTKPFGKPVTMEFIQPFAKVRFVFKYANPNADPLPLLENPDFRPTNPAHAIARSGTITLTFPIAGTEKEESWATSGIGKTLSSFTTVWESAEDWYTVLPAVSQGTFTLTVRVDGEERTAVVPEQYMDWQPGYQYTYIFKVNEEGGVELQSVSLGYTDWQGNEEKEHPVYNW